MRVYAIIDTTDCQLTAQARAVAGLGVAARCKSVLQGEVLRRHFGFLAHQFSALCKVRGQSSATVLVREALFRIQSP